MTGAPRAPSRAPSAGTATSTARPPPRPVHPRAPLARGASEEETAAHDAKSAELARYKMGVVSSDDADGFHRVACPATLGKVRCPRRPASMALSAARPEIMSVPEEPPTCCTQKTLTVPPSVNAKTRQKHDYPSRAHRLSYGRRSAAQRSNATVKDPASNDVSRGWCRVMGLTSITLMLSCLFVVRNQRILVFFAVARSRKPTTLGARTHAKNPPPQPHDDFRPGQCRRQLATAARCQPLRDRKFGKSLCRRGYLLRSVDPRHCR